MNVGNINQVWEDKMTDKLKKIRTRPNLKRRVERKMGVQILGLSATLGLVILIWAINILFYNSVGIALGTTIISVSILSVLVCLGQQMKILNSAARAFT